MTFLTTPIFDIKLVAIGLGVWNLRLMRQRVFGNPANLGTRPVLREGKDLASTSLAFWALAIYAGRTSATCRLSSGRPRSHCSSSSRSSCCWSDSSLSACGDRRDRASHCRTASERRSDHLPRLPTERKTMPWNPSFGYWLRWPSSEYFLSHYAWAWPLCEVVHFFGIVLLVGIVGVFDLRVLGVPEGPAARPAAAADPLGDFRIRPLSRIRTLVCDWHWG